MSLKAPYQTVIQYVGTWSNATVVTTSTANPVLSIVTSSTTGTVAVNNISTLSLIGLN